MNTSKSVDCSNCLVVVTSRSFSNDPLLRERLLARFPQAKFNLVQDRLSPAEFAEWLIPAEAVIVGLDRVDEELLNQCKRLRIIAKYGVGLDNIDLESCRARGVVVGWTGGVNRLSVAEQTVGFMIAMSRNLYQSSILIKSGKWARNGGFQLSGKCVGIIGVGYIGKEVIRLLEPFQCRILVNDIIDQNDYYIQKRLTECSKEDMLREADIVTIHTPLNMDTHHLMNRRTLAMMKPTSFLVNTSRGPVVHQEDLKAALISKTIAGAALDVFENEPPSDQELLGLPNLFCTPHIGGNAREAVRAMGLSAIRHLESFYGIESDPIP